MRARGIHLSELEEHGGAAGVAEGVVLDHGRGVAGRGDEDRLVPTALQYQGDVAQSHLPVAEGGLERVDRGRAENSGGRLGVRRGHRVQQLLLHPGDHSGGVFGPETPLLVEDRHLLGQPARGAGVEERRPGAHLQRGVGGRDGQEDHRDRKYDQGHAYGVRYLPQLPDAVNQAPADSQGHSGLPFS